MKTVSLKIDDSIFGETERRLILEKMLKTESDLVKKDSISVHNDFERIDYAD